MITASPSVVYMEPTLPLWQQELAHSRLTPQQLVERLQLPEQLIESITQSEADFPIRATESYLRRIEPGNLDDPLLKQILPAPPERDHSAPGFSSDPVGDCSAIQTGGILQKYRGRALLITTAACAIHCRYCFRRHYPYQQHTLEFNQQTVAQWLEKNPSIDEVILSGGDPLMLSDRRLTALLEQFEAIPHLKTLRFHSRMPVVLPSRITDELLQQLQQSHLKMVMVIHCNHPHELNDETFDVLQQMQQNGITLLNQSVLLKGVNDSADTLIQLSHTLFEQGVLPYYLHLLDRVHGSQHFEVAEAEAEIIHQQLRNQLPGYLLPRLVREIEGEPSKTPIG